MDLFITINLLADDDADLVRLGAGAFRDGLAEVCTALQARFAPLGPAFADCLDFIRAAVDRAAQVPPCPRGLTPHRLQLAWIETRGFRSLLAASRRWHARDWGPPDPGAHDQPLAAMLGEYSAGEAQGRELCEAADLVREGATMHHCVAQYWAECRDRGTRIFALALGADRATAEYHFAPSEARFSLAQLRPRLAAGELLRDFIAGYQFHGGIELEPQMGVGDTLELVREPENPHNHQAVAIRWGGVHVGYVPRRVNADIARRLDAGERLSGHLTRLDPQAETWQRVEFAIREIRAE